MPQNGAVLEKCVLLSGSSQLVHNQSIIIHLNQFFREACAQGVVGPPIIDQLISQVNLNTRSSAQMAAVIIQSNDQLRNMYINNIFKILSNPSDQDQLVRTTLCLGEIGVFVDLSKMQGIIQILSSLFEHADDQVRQASAISLGGISIGNTEYFIPQVFELINKSQ